MTKTMSQRIQVSCDEADRQRGQHANAQIHARGKKENANDDS
jgi:hypothetical protein